MPRERVLQSRSACDRCHGQKLRCERREGTGRCVRCDRLDATCIFSSRQRKATKSSPNPETSSNDGSGSFVVPEQQPIFQDPAAYYHPSTSSSSTGHDFGQLALLMQAATTNNFTLPSQTAPVPTFTSAGHSPIPSIEIDDDAQTLLPDWQSLFDFSNPDTMPLWNQEFVPTMDSTSNMPTPTGTYPAPPRGVQGLSLNDSMAGFHLASSPAPGSDAFSIGPDPNANPSSTMPDPSAYIPLLADLNARLYEQAKSLPSRAHSIDINQPGQAANRAFSIDQTFRLTESLIEILNHLYPPSPSRQSSVTPFPAFRQQSVSSSTTSSPAPSRSSISSASYPISPPNPNTLPSHALSSPAPPDQGSVFLILSCANRVFDIFETIFRHVHEGGTSVAEGFPLSSMTTIGSYTPPQQWAASLQMLMLVMMSAELFERLQDVLDIWKQASGGTGRSSSVSGAGKEKERQLPSKVRFPVFAESAVAEMARRARLVAVQIGNARNMLMGMQGLRGSTRQGG